jgi:hypothetical protein
MYKASKSVEKGITSVENRVLDIGLEDLMGVDEFFLRYCFIKAETVRSALADFGLATCFRNRPKSYSSYAKPASGYLHPTLSICT